MKKIANSESKRNVLFLDFIFNPFLRTLEKKSTVIQLRKKPSDVFELLCVKYPNPVSQVEFLAEVWGGGYVTSQSIAQVIRSLRVSLGDKSKSIIVTIPKLGYQLAVEPRWETVLDESESLNEKNNFNDFSTEKMEVNNEFFTTPPVIDLESQKTPYVIPCQIPTNKTFNPKVIFFSVALAIIFGFVFTEMNERSFDLDTYQDKKFPSQYEPANIMKKQHGVILCSCLELERVKYYPKQEDLLFFQPIIPAVQDDTQSF